MKRWSTPTVKTMPNEKTPEEFAMHCAGMVKNSGPYESYAMGMLTSAATNQKQRPRDVFAAYALGIVSGTALRKRRAFPEEIVRQAISCKSWEDIEALEARMK